MGAFKLLVVPIRSLVRFPLVQLAAVIAVILLLQGAEPNSAVGRLFVALDRLVERSVAALAAAFDLRSFTKSWLTTSLWIGYVYLAGLVILAILRGGVQLAADLAARWNLFWLRSAIARERGIAAYRAWEPFERIRPGAISQERWEEAYAWPASGEPPYPPLAWRMVLGVLGYLIVLLALAALLEYFTPVPALTWLGAMAQKLIG